MATNLSTTEIDPNRSRTLEEIQTWLIYQLAERLKIEPDEIDIHEPFDNYNLDSAQALILLEKLEKWLQRKYNPILIFNYPTIAELAERLVSETLPNN
ncbi:MAG: acyl carrier protein [Hydrococcus sp. CSU_1_8]|nr:acyl carrier protein [Hydrococcus sp. CSU_1_8]